MYPSGKMPMDEESGYDMQNNANGKDRDPRFKATIQAPNATYDAYGFEPWAGGKASELQSQRTGMCLQKYIDPLYNDVTAETRNVRKNIIHIFRYNEILLNYAEAMNEYTGPTSDVYSAINAIRSRVGMPDLPSNLTQDQMREKIRHERRVELAGEGRRWDDLMRWKAGKLLEKEPEGLYFPGLGKYDLTGDGIEDIYLIPSDANIPAEADKETNSLGEKLVYYRTGSIDDVNATVYLREGTKGNILTIKDMGTFQEPKYYYRPVPKHEMDLNPNLGPQLFGWE